MPRLVAEGPAEVAEAHGEGAAPRRGDRQAARRQPVWREVVAQLRADALQQGLSSERSQKVSASRTRRNCPCRAMVAAMRRDTVSGSAVPEARSRKAMMRAASMPAAAAFQSECRVSR
ncbi:MAG: hypothetical protein U0232_26745 [Thermomicrobiales bacterium]